MTSRLLTKAPEEPWFSHYFWKVGDFLSQATGDPGACILAMIDGDCPFHTAETAKTVLLGYKLRGRIHP